MKPMPAPDDHVEAIESTDRKRPGRRVKRVAVGGLVGRADLWRRFWKRPR